MLGFTSICQHAQLAFSFRLHQICCYTNLLLTKTSYSGSGILNLGKVCAGHNTECGHAALCLRSRLTKEPMLDSHASTEFPGLPSACLLRRSRTDILFCFRFSLFEGFMMSWLTGSWDFQINTVLLKTERCFYLFLLGAQ